MDIRTLNDARRLSIFRDSAMCRQEAMVQFILGCADMASDLRKICRLREQAGMGEDAGKLIEDRIAAEFRQTFGHPLFPNVPDQR